jgi:hypothetical protein
MADLDALKNDVEEVLKMVPHEIVHAVAYVASSLLSKFRDQLPAIAAAGFMKLQPHVKALGLELSTGMMDVKELEPVLIAALENALKSHTGVPVTPPTPNPDASTR